MTRWASDCSTKLTAITVRMLNTADDTFSLFSIFFSTQVPDSYFSTSGKR